MAESPKFRFGAVILVTGALGALVWSVVYSQTLAQDQVRPPVVVPMGYVNPGSGFSPNPSVTRSVLAPPMAGGGSSDGFGIAPGLPGPMPMGGGAVGGGSPDPFAATAGGPTPPPVTPPGAGPMMGSGPTGMVGMASMMMGGRPGDQYQNAEREYAAQARELLKRYAAESNPQTQAELKKILRDSLIAQFDLQHRRRDEELQWIEKRVAELRSKLKRRADAVNTIVDRRLEQLISDVDGLGWGADDLPQDLFEMGMSGSGSMMPGRGRRPAGGMAGPGGMMAPGMGRSPNPISPRPGKAGENRPGAENPPVPATFLPQVTPQPGQPPTTAPSALPPTPATTPPGAGAAPGSLPGLSDDAFSEPLDVPRTETTVQPAIPGTGPSPTPAIPEGAVPVPVAPGTGTVPTNNPPGMN